MTSIQAGASLAKRLFPLAGPEGITTLRLVLAALILCALWRPWRVRLERPALKAVALYGGALGLMNLTFYLALERLPLGLTVAIEFTGPLAVALYASRRGLDLLWAALAVAGIGLILPIAADAPLDPLGLLFVLVAAACWAAYIVFGQRAGALAHGGTATALGMAVAAVVGAPLGAVKAGAALLEPSVLALGLAVAVLSSALPYSLEMVALKRLKAQTFSVLMSLEPALAALMGFLLLGERLTPRQWAAITCIVAASVGAAWGGVKPDAAPVQA
ncbi:MAG: EamA family transporter [Elusimicrobiota bacterium]|nr:EamA family transporter [Elusimicrobiota bacterium]